jgi:TPR repeat protein
MQPSRFSALRCWILVLTFAVVACSSGRADDRKVLFDGLEKLARQGNAEAQYHLGMMFNNGIGTPQDPKQAFEWFEKAARAGDPLGSYKVGCYFAGQFGGVVPVDADKALHHKLVAAQAGYSLAQHDVGVAFLERNEFERAVKWWEAAARQGYAVALHNLSFVYKEGKMVPGDSVRAYAYFKIGQLLAVGHMRDEAQAALDRLKNTMSASEVERAEQIVSGWKPEPTLLTRRASAGLEDAKRLVQGK